MDVAMSSKRNSLHRGAVKLIFQDANLITDQKLKEMRIMSLQKQQQMKYNKGLFMYRVLNNDGPEYTSNLYANTPSHSRNCQLSFTMMPQSMHLTCTQILPHALKNISLVCLGQG